MEMLTWKKFFEVVAFVVVFAVPVILYLMEKAGKSLTWIFILGWASIAAAALYLVLSIPWVWADAPLVVRAWRISLMSAIALLAVSYGAIKIWPNAASSNEAKKTAAPTGETAEAKEPFRVTVGPAMNNLPDGADIEGMVMAFERPQGHFTVVPINVWAYISLTNMHLFSLWLKHTAWR